MTENAFFTQGYQPHKLLQFEAIVKILQIGHSFMDLLPFKLMTCVLFEKSYRNFCLYLKLYLTSRTRRLLLSTVFMSDTIFHIFSLNSYSRALKEGVGWPLEVKKRKLKTRSIFVVQANLGLKRPTYVAKSPVIYPSV